MERDQDIPVSDHMVEVLEFPETENVIAVCVKMREELFGPLALDDELWHEHVDGVIAHQASRVARHVLLKDGLHFWSEIQSRVKFGGCYNANFYISV